MTLPDRLHELLPTETGRAWELLGGVAPPEAYLVGGTAIAVHLAHRRSRDLDFFLEAPVDLDALTAALEAVGPLVVTARDAQTLNCLLDDARVQFLEASDQHMIEPTVEVAGLRVAGLGDLMATKLNAIPSRPAARDYFDLMTIEEAAHRYVEEGLALFVERCRPTAPEQAVTVIVRSLGYLGDVPDDPGLPVRLADLEHYWQRRLREITAHLDRHGIAP